VVIVQGGMYRCQADEHTLLRRYKPRRHIATTL